MFNLVGLVFHGEKRSSQIAIGARIGFVQVVHQPFALNCNLEKVTVFLAYPGKIAVMILFCSLGETLVSDKINHTPPNKICGIGLVKSGIFQTGIFVLVIEVEERKPGTRLSDEFFCNKLLFAQFHCDLRINNQIFLTRFLGPVF